VVIA
jgi:alkanesulfonate monooxygenase SsuD/methylene tetrahydromethanopterin reductase-like flavin-dependent oxidoreductase (luciferase family)